MNGAFEPTGESGAASEGDPVVCCGQTVLFCDNVIVLGRLCYCQIPGTYHRIPLSVQINNFPGSGGTCL